MASPRISAAGALLLVVGVAFHCSLLAAEPTKEQKEFFEQKIAPILSDSCYKCHSAAEGKTKGGLALDSREALLKGGDDGKIVAPGDPAKSMLIQRVLSKDPDEKMPPKEAKLTAQQVADLTAWIKMGAPDPRTGGGAAPIAVRSTASAKTHWAWQPIRPQPIPLTKGAAWCKTPVDNFILAKLERQGIAPSAPAERATLIRRAYFDLIGLPPMPWEVQAFIDDKSPNAWEKVIDRLLASPHYGERWGRYWLDVARYSDTAGDAPKKESPLYVDAWTYRDYIIDAFNQDKPYDRFIVEQLAADKLNLGQDKRPLAALGFLTVGDRFNGNRNDRINDQIDVVTKGFLGLTVSCARCHDHMFDPIPQKDYYSLHGIFASTLEPKDNPIISAQTDAKLYQDYLRTREAALNDAKQFAETEMERIRKLFRENAATFLLASRVEGAERQQYLKGFGERRRLVEDMMQLLRRGGAFQRRNPVLGLWAQFAELPKDSFAEKARALCSQLAANSDRRFPVNSVVAAAFKDKAPQSLEDVAAIYGELFKATQQKVAAQAASAAGKPASAVAGRGMEGDSEELRVAPFRDDPLKSFDEKEIAARLPQKLGVQFQQKLAALAKIELTHPGAPKRAMAVADAPKPQNSPVFIRGEAASKGEVVPHRFLEILSGPNRPEFKDGSGRLDLAQAIASKSNPLTPRVMVNRIWEHHFGEGFVTTPDDFGTQSAPPSHPELLDYLAGRFLQSGWSVKAMHKLIMMSAVYQQKSETNPAYAAADPNNRLLWRYNIRRLEFEPLRDSLLYISGKLDLAMGGHPVNILSEPYSMRRSVYGFIDRGNLPEMMNHFDFANPGMPLGKRHETTVPQQALFMMNSPLMVDVARKLLDRPEMAQAKTDAQKVHALYWMIYQRPPKQEEIDLGLEFVTASSSTASAEGGEPAVVLASADGGPAAMRQAKMTKQQLIQQRKQNVQEQRRGGGFQLVNEGEKVERRPLTAWEKYTHALLMANETIYYN